MKTKGLMVVEGWVMLERPTYAQAVPEQFWNRLKHAIARAGLVDEYRTEYALERHMVLAARETSAGWNGKADELAREERLFRRWVERVCGPQTLWPWERGWTEEAVDSYLMAPVRRENAA